jgi:hypothetical protein
MASSNSAKITDNFPHKSIAPIAGQPTHQTIQELHLKLNENAVKVHLNLGNGLLRHLSVTVAPAIFNTLSATPFVLPPNPGIAPAFPDAATGPAIANIRQTFKEEHAEFKCCMDACNAVSTLVVKVIDPVCLAALRLPCIDGLGNRTPLEILAHLCTDHANITPGNLEQNGLAMQQPCDVLSIAHLSDFCTGTFADKRQPAAHKTWDQFKIGFALRAKNTMTHWTFLPKQQDSMRRPRRTSRKAPLTPSQL